MATNDLSADYVLYPEVHNKTYQMYTLKLLSACIFICDVHFQAMLHLIQEAMGVDKKKATEGDISKRRIHVIPVSENISLCKFVTCHNYNSDCHS